MDILCLHTGREHQYTGYCHNLIGDTFVRIRFVLETAPSHASIPPNQHGTMNEAGKCIRENTALRTKFRVRVQACHAAVSLEFTFGRLGVMRSGALIGQRTCWLMT